MKRTTVYLTDEQLGLLGALAERRGTSVAELVRAGELFEDHKPRTLPGDVRTGRYSVCFSGNNNTVSDQAGDAPGRRAAGAAPARGGGTRHGRQEVSLRKLPETRRQRTRFRGAAFAGGRRRRIVKLRDVLHLLGEDGWQLVTTRGSHRQLKHPTKSGRVTVAGRPSDDLHPRPPRASLVRQA
jgi:predicted RNA binding protein YcfA (HicA-like mRNA interferase family)